MSIIIRYNMLISSVFMNLYGRRTRQILTIDKPLENYKNKIYQKIEDDE